ncbi:hypothetical protein CSB11_02415 [Candidatus Campbellbacteria bacterium]|nr:MAG: hypothetical protein CSB11_02415 [Candidatus Campbellbacteria bacterium]
MKKFILVVVCFFFSFAHSFAGEIKEPIFKKLNWIQLELCQQKLGGKTDVELNQYLYKKAGFNSISDLQYSDLEQEFAFLEKKIKGIYSNPELVCFSYAKAANLFRTSIKEVNWEDAESFFGDIKIQFYLDWEKYDKIFYYFAEGYDPI